MGFFSEMFSSTIIRGPEMNENHWETKARDANIAEHKKRVKQEKDATNPGIWDALFHIEKGTKPLDEPKIGGFWDDLFGIKSQQTPEQKKKNTWF